MLNERTICKPLNSRELDFYQNIPQDIQMFVPQYKGRLFVKISAYLSTLHIMLCGIVVTAVCFACCRLKVEM